MATMLPELRSDVRVASRSSLHRRSDCLATVSIQADVRRVMHALTIPEYIEAWMEFPGIERIACIAEGKEQAGVRLELYTAGKLRAQVRGRHCIMAPTHLMVAWSNVNRGASDDSLVDIRIRRMRQGCLVVLRHTQLGTSRKTLWNSTVWQRSLEKLSHLLEG